MNSLNLLICAPSLNFDSFPAAICEFVTAFLKWNALLLLVNLSIIYAIFVTLTLETYQHETLDH